MVHIKIDISTIQQHKSNQIKSNQIKSNQIKQTMNTVLREAEYTRRYRANPWATIRIQHWYRAQLLMKKQRFAATVRIQAMIRGAMVRVQSAKAKQVRFGSARKSIRGECKDCLGIGLSDYSVRTWRAALSLVREGKVTDMDEALYSLQISMHGTRRQQHEFPYLHYKSFLISHLSNAKTVKKSCSVGYDKGPAQMPFLMIPCCKEKPNCIHDVEVRSIVTKLKKLAVDASATGHAEYAEEFDRTATQFQSVEMNALHLLVPHRVTMCPGKCKHSSGMVVTPFHEERVSRCGNRACDQCGYITKKVATKVVTCTECHTDDGRPMRWCVECGGDHNPSALCDHKAKWKRLPEDDRKHFEKMVADGIAQHCPQCYLLVEKSGGCDKMTCNECGFKFCLKCGDQMGADYVTSHLFAANGGEELICRKTVVTHAFHGKEPYLDEVVRAYQGRSRLVVRDVDRIAREMPWDQIPAPLRQLLRPERAQVDQGRVQEDVDALLAAQMMAEMLDGRN